MYVCGNNFSSSFLTNIGHPFDMRLPLDYEHSYTYVPPPSLTIIRPLTRLFAGSLLFPLPPPPPPPLRRRR